MNNIIAIIALICAIWVIYDVWAKQKMGAGAKLLWTLFALLFSIVTAIVYYLMKKR